MNVYKLTSAGRYELSYMVEKGIMLNRYHSSLNRQIRKILQRNFGHD